MTQFKTRNQLALAGNALVLSAALVGTTLVNTAWADGHIPADVKLAEDQTFTYRLLDEFSSLDPQVVEDVEGSNVVRDLFEGLMSQDAAGNLVPGVATGFSVNDDNTVYTFTLRENAKWSNGDPITANDFVYAWQRAASPELASPYQWYIELMSLKNASDVVKGEKPKEELGVKAVDDLTFEVTLSAPLPYFPQMTTHSTTFPSPQKVIEEHGAEWTKPENIVSNGAYVLTEHLPNERSVRELSLIHI